VQQYMTQGVTAGVLRADSVGREPHAPRNGAKRIQAMPSKTRIQQMLLARLLFLAASPIATGAELRRS